MVVDREQGQRGLGLDSVEMEPPSRSSPNPPPQDHDGAANRRRRPISDASGIGKKLKALFPGKTSPMLLQKEEMAMKLKCLYCKKR
ncbi:hypothetical protein E2562_009297 [Oryza meyeriana var. granulata]|uniref:Uncharacterized protein n=1 Tax=Oryza meyeriana var. granulata TaxID=110450 RepID=A0A6G1EAE6_9ORYZ|nr:hypothetical protein E2562_009297 [Oryza meyeriana var. granulata]